MTTDELAVQLNDVENRAKSNSHRIDQIQKKQDALDQLASVMAGQQKDIEHINRDVKEIKGDVKSLMDLPGKRWNEIVSAVVVAIAGALAGGVLTLLIG